MKWVTIMARLEFIAFYTFPPESKGGMSLLCSLRPFVVVLWHFHVAGQKFEEILQHLKIL